MDLSNRAQLLVINPDKEIKVEVAIELDNGQLGIFQCIETMSRLRIGMDVGLSGVSNRDLRANWREFGHICLDLSQALC
jgi:hypothetical protein